MFEKILIANRGEIACRVIKTARKMGVRTVAVYSDADRDALHVSMADEAVHIGAAPPRESYLQMEKVIAAAQQTGARAIHPGYGFLSENAAFCKLCASNDIVFIGPPTGAIEAMGSKSAAKTIMEKAGVPLVPGYHGDNQGLAFLKGIADKMGYPVLLKAAAGGGGKGMRQVWSADEFDAALNAAKRESLSAFNDDIMLVEKYLTQPRHVEIQVFFDQHGNGVYLAERDCSVQRRHQKIIEEAPAPGISAATRKKMGEAALEAASAIDYVGAGTVEFLLDRDGAFYFMEMNTRLQVEHPVTEFITGQDLVEWQLRVAAGEPLPLQQSDITLAGHAVEVRIYAEDPNNDFLPATGKLSFLQTPVEDEHVRIDTGVRQGDTVSVYYDPMIAKLVVWDDDRNKALRRMAGALSDYCIDGVTTNIDFLYNLVSCAPFMAAELDTGFIEKHHAAIYQDSEQDLQRDVPLAALYLVLVQQQAAQQASNNHDPHSPWSQANAWRMNQPNLHAFELQCQGKQISVSVEDSNVSGTHRYCVRYNGQRGFAQGSLQDNQLHSDIDGYRSQAAVAAHDGRYSMFSPRSVFQFSVLQADLGDEGDGSHDGGLNAPMNGTIVELSVAAGSKVEKGDSLLVMEAMKMEHTIRAPAAGMVKEFFYQAGSLVEGGAELLSFEDDE